jgi:lipopolysaccharide export LptBFGC system permease protein LptF
VTSASYEPASKTWRLEQLKIVDYDRAGNITKDQYLVSTNIEGWSETPFRLSSANVRPEFLGIPELRQYVDLNADFPKTLLAPFQTQLQYRWALPWTCFVVSIMAAPLGIGFSRRGILASVAAAIGLVFAMNFLTHLFLALGEGDRLSPLAAAWTPNAIFFVVGLYLLHLRATNRETPSFNPARLWRNLRAT